MTERKYITEFALNTVISGHVLLQQENINMLENIIKEVDIAPNIYFIARRPRITIEPNSFVFSKEKVTGIFKKQVKDKYLEIPFETENLLGTDDVTLECDYPYNEFQVIENSTKKVISGGKTSLLLLSCLGKNAEQHLDLEIIYIGQSFGNDGSRNAATRLKSHSTLQNIYSEAIRKTPDQEIWLIASALQDPIIITSMDGRTGKYGTTIEEDDDHIDNVFSNGITRQQQINYTEATLIRYFQPEFNITYKDTYPNPSHKTYSECYDLDLNCTSVELQTDIIYARFYSSVIKPDYYHLCIYPLTSREDRVYMFDLAQIGGVDSI